MRLFPVLPLFAASLLLGACQSLGTHFPDLSKIGHSQEEQVTQAMVDAAREASRAGETTQVLAFYEQLLVQNPKNEELALDYARLLTRENRPEKALAVLKPFIIRDVDNAPLFTQYARLHFRQQDSEAAQKFAQMGFAKQPDYIPSVLVLSAAMTMNGQHEHAQTLLRSTQKTAPQEWQDVIANNLALTLVAAGNIEQAQTQMDRAVELATKHSDKINQNDLLIDTLSAAPAQD